MSRWRCLCNPLAALHSNAIHDTGFFCAAQFYSSVMLYQIHCPVGLADTVGTNRELVEGTWRAEVADVFGEMNTLILFLTCRSSL